MEKKQWEQSAYSPPSQSKKNVAAKWSQLVPYFVDHISLIICRISIFKNKPDKKIDFSRSSMQYSSFIS